MKYIPIDSIEPTNVVLNADSLDVQLRALNCYGADINNTALLQSYGFIGLSEIEETQPTASSILVADKDTENNWYLKWMEKDEFDDQKVLQSKGSMLRARRNRLLTQSDWSQAADIPFTNEQRQAWTTYRQALRDITNQPGFPTNVEWPTRPNK